MMPIGHSGVGRGISGIPLLSHRAHHALSAARATRSTIPLRLRRSSSQNAPAKARADHDHARRHLTLPWWCPRPSASLHSAGTAHLPLAISFISHLPLPLRLATVRYFHPPSEGHPGCLFCVWFSQWGELNHQARIQAAVPTAIEVGLRSLLSECATRKSAKPARRRCLPGPAVHLFFH